jgi:condensin complex subunit 2
MADDQDLMAASEAPLKRARPEFVQYAKRAKRVDVRKLKESIWKGLDIVVDEKADDSNAGVGDLFLVIPNTWH